MSRFFKFFLAGFNSVYVPNLKTPAQKGTNFKQLAKLIHHIMGVNFFCYWGSDWQHCDPTKNRTQISVMCILCNWLNKDL